MHNVYLHISPKSVEKYQENLRPQNRLVKALGVSASAWQFCFVKPSSHVFGFFTDTEPKESLLY